MKKFFKTFFLSILIFAILAVGIIYITSRTDEDELAETEDEEAVEKGNFLSRLFSGEDEITFLLLGVDTEDMEVSRSRTDTMILCKANKSTGDISLLSIPRDTKARIRGRENEEKINHAHAYGGPELSMSAVKDLLGVSVEYYVAADFQLVKEFVDIIGGVEVEVPVEMTVLPQGKQLLDGDQALKFVRFRKGYSDQDLGRIKAQQHFIKAAAKTTLRPSNILNLPQLIKSYYGNVNTNIPLDLIMKYALKANTFDVDGMQMETLPGVAKNIDGLSYFIADEAESAKLVREMFTVKKVLK